MRLGPMEQMVQDQILEEYPDYGFGEVKFIHVDSGREFRDLDALTYFIANQMWDTFDEGLMYIKEKGKTNGKD